MRQSCLRYKELTFFFDGDFDGGGDVAKDLDGDVAFADNLDGFRELDLALVDLKTLCFESFGDVGGGYRAEHLIIFAGFAGEPERHTVEQAGLLLRSFQFGGGFLGQRGTNALER